MSVAALPGVNAKPIGPTERDSSSGSFSLPLLRWTGAIIENCLGSPSQTPQYRQLFRSAPGGAVFWIRSTIFGAYIWL